MTMKKTLAAAVLAGLAAFSAQAQDSGNDALIAELRAMAPAERRAALRAMPQEQRQGLWFAVKQAEWADKEMTQAGNNFYRNADTSGTPRPSGLAGRAVGSIQYDDGIITTSFGGGAIIGNRFNTHDAGIQVTQSGTVSTVIGVVVQGPAFTTSSAGFVLEGPQTGGGGAFAIFSSFTGATGTTDTVTFSGIGGNYTGSSFFVLFGDFSNSYVPAFGSGSTNAQGHHGVVGYTGGMGPNITSTFDFGGTLNGLVRATGNILPVELTEFGVE